MTKASFTAPKKNIFNIHLRPNIEQYQNNLNWTIQLSLTQLYTNMLFFSFFLQKKKIAQWRVSSATSPQSLPTFSWGSFFFVVNYLPLSCRVSNATSPQILAPSLPFPIGIASVQCLAGPRNVIFNGLELSPLSSSSRKLGLQQSFSVVRRTRTSGLLSFLYYRRGVKYFFYKENYIYIDFFIMFLYIKKIM